MKKDKHQFEYVEENNEETIQQIKDVYTVGAIEQHQDNQEKYDD